MTKKADDVLIKPGTLVITVPEGLIWIVLSDWQHDTYGSRGIYCYLVDNGITTGGWNLEHVGKIHLLNSVESPKNLYFDAGPKGC